MVAVQVECRPIVEIVQLKRRMYIFLKFSMLIPQSHILKFIVGIVVLCIMGNLKCCLKV